MITKPKRYTAKFVLQEARDMLLSAVGDGKIVYIKQLFIPKDYTYERFHEWARDFKDNKEISLTLKKINELLESRLVVGGLTKGFAPKITTLLLTNKYGFTERTEHTVGGDQNNPILTNVVVTFVEPTDTKETPTTD